MTEPILSFFYCTKDLVEKDIKTESMNVHTFQVPVYSDYARTKQLGDLTYLGIGVQSDNFVTLADTSVLSILNNNDSISWIETNKRISQIVPDDRTIISRIIGGAGIYTFTEGYVVVNTFQNGDRICYVYAK